MPLYDITAEPSFTLFFATEVMEVTGTELGIAICHICFPCKFEDENNSVWLDEACKEMVAGSKPGGGAYGSRDG